MLQWYRLCAQNDETCFDWEEYKSIFRIEVKATEWAIDKVKEAFEKVARDEARSTVQEIMIKSTDYSRRIIAPVGRQGGVTSHISTRIKTVSRWKTTFGGSQGRKHTTWCCGENFDWRAPNRLLVVQTGVSVNQTCVGI